jgi:hypothetical protein
VVLRIVKDCVSAADFESAVQASGRAFDYPVAKPGGLALVFVDTGHLELIGLRRARETRVSTISVSSRKLPASPLTEAQCRASVSADVGDVAILLTIAMRQFPRRRRGLPARRRWAREA